IIGINSNFYNELEQAAIFELFYHVIRLHKSPPMTVAEAIGDLPPIYPLTTAQRNCGRNFSHFPFSFTTISNHIPRFHNLRDINTFRMLAEDIESGKNIYTSIENLKVLYTKLTGRKSNIHKYYVLRRDQPSNTIPAHLYKDGMRHIHPDSKQARSITVREAARLQTFDDDYIFTGSMGAQYKMIGNAVPPKFAEILSIALSKVLSVFYHG
ncbi:MAG: DNA cytosine methyltransferase, partial [Muribaculaceae bacterium]|nr:DNA cytosine methyltransferase [Muribaculaceae bacterium]